MEGRSIKSGLGQSTKMVKILEEFPEYFSVAYDDINKTRYAGYTFALRYSFWFEFPLGPGAPPFFPFLGREGKGGSPGPKGNSNPVFPFFFSLQAMCVLWGVQCAHDILTLGEKVSDISVVSDHFACYEGVI